MVQVIPPDGTLGPRKGAGLLPKVTEQTVAGPLNLRQCSLHFPLERSAGGWGIRPQEEGQCGQLSPVPAAAGARRAVTARQGLSPWGCLHLGLQSRGPLRSQGQCGVQRSRLHVALASRETGSSYRGDRSLLGRRVASECDLSRVGGRRQTVGCAPLGLPGGPASEVGAARAVPTPVAAQAPPGPLAVCTLAPSPGPTMVTSASASPSAELAGYRPWRLHQAPSSLSGVSPTPAAPL